MHCIRHFLMKARSLVPSRMADVWLSDGLSGRWWRPLGHFKCFRRERLAALGRRITGRNLQDQNQINTTDPQIFPAGIRPQKNNERNVPEKMAPLNSMRDLNVKGSRRLGRKSTNVNDDSQVPTRSGEPITVHRLTLFT